MKTHNPKASTRSVRKSTSKKKDLSMLATCPVQGAGWCPYPFSPAQLAKRLKLKAATMQASAQTQLAVSQAR